MTGIIVSVPPTVELPPGSTTGGSAVLPGVTYTYAVLNFPQTWTAKQTFPLGNISLQAGDVVGLVASATTDTTNASNITSGTLAAVVMPALTGDVTTSVGTVATSIGATKVTSAMLNANVFSTAHTWGGQQTFVAPILGTPASGVATNLTGTAAGLTAGTVTTNANLTGPITSVGNATSIASQTGSGTKFVVDTSPTVVTPTFTGTTTLSGGASDTLIVGNTATSNAFTVNSQGDIGVGTLLTPDSSHHLSFEIIRNTTTDAAFTLRNRNDGAGTRAVLHFFTGTTDQMDASIDVASIAGGAAVNWRTGTGATGGFNLLQAANGPINFYTNNTLHMSLSAAGGLSFSPTTGGIVGTTTNDSATAGNVGEYIESVVLVGSAVSLTSGTAKDVTTLTLGAGDWDVDASLDLNTVAAGGTSVTAFGAYISLVANTTTSTPGTFSQHVQAAFVPNGVIITESVAPYRFSLSGSTTLHLVALGVFTVSTMTAYGIIRARRVR